MTFGEWVPGRSRWLSTASLWGNGLVACSAAFYVEFSVRGATDMTFWVWACLLAGVALTTNELLLQRRLPTLRALGEGGLPSSVEHRARALTEVQRFADAAALQSAVVWVVAAVVLALLLRGLDAVSWRGVGRLVVVGLLFGPISAVMVGLMTGLRVFRAVEMLSPGLPPVEVPAVSGSRTGARLVVFTAIMVALPSLMLADVARTSTEALGQTLLDPRVGAAAVDALVAEQQHELIVRMASLCLTALTLAVVAAWLGASTLVDPLRRVADEATAMARGDLGGASHIEAAGEVALVTSVFVRMKQRLVEVIRQLHRAGGEIDTATASLHATARQYESGANEQATALDETSTTTESLAKSARQIAHNAAAVHELAAKTLEAAEAGRARAEAFQASVERMKQDNRSIASSVERLQQRVYQIGSIVEFINSVADRSDLLALSAELEGTRAGDVGRGFALVAGEMRRLAENVLESTAEVEELIGEIREATRQTAQATEAGSSLTHGSTSLATEVARSLTTVAELAQKTSTAVRSISLATQQQETGTDQLAEAMADILGLTQQGLATTQQLSVANEQLRALSMNLSSVVDKFT